MSCECKIEVCYVDAVECGGSFHGYVDKRLVHFKRCFECRDLQSQLEAARKENAGYLGTLSELQSRNSDEKFELTQQLEAAKRENEQSDHLTVENTRLVSELADLNAENERLRADFEQRYKNACEKFDRRHAEDDEEIVRLNTSLAEVTKALLKYGVHGDGCFTELKGADKSACSCGLLSKLKAARNGGSEDAKV